MAKKPKKPQEEQFVDLPENRIDQIINDAPEDENGKKPQSKASVSPNTEQAKGDVQSETDGSKKDVPGNVPSKREPSKEDLLEDIRLELAGDEEVKEKKGFFSRIKDRFKKGSSPKKEELALPELPESIIETQEELQELAVELKPKKKKQSSTKQEEKAVQEFFADLEALADVVPAEGESSAVEGEEILPEKETPEEKVQIPKLPVKSDKEEIDFDKVREMALQEYDETRVEPTVERKVSLQEEVQKTIRESRPFERVLMIAVFALVAGALLFSGVFIIVRSIPTPTPTPTVVLNLDEMVYPTQLNLPGGWDFNLGQGRVDEDGKWAPSGAEWLMGTEISRWVALPWSLQLEAVLRTLKAGDKIELTMSNLDRLEFNVNAIQELSMEEIQAFDPKIPGLLIVLFEEENDSGTYWVVTAVP